MARRRAAAGHARAACSVAVLVLLTGPALLGTLGFIVPALIMAAALLVIDVGVRASLVGDAVMPAASAALLLVLGRGPAEILLFAIPAAVLMTLGTALGLALSRYDAALAALARGSIRASLASPSSKRRWLAQVDAWLAG